MKRLAWLSLVLVIGAQADEGLTAEDAPGVKALSGMSVLGNNEAPKSLVIVPWKSSSLGDGIGIENLLDERAQPVDKEVFLRELSYYGIRTAQTGDQTTGTH